MIQGLENPPQQKRLKDIGLFFLKRGLRRSHITVLQYLKAAAQGMKVRSSHGKAKGNRNKLHREKFHLTRRRSFLE